MRRALPILFGLFCLLGLASTALADAAADYQKGRNAYLYLDFKKAIKLLDPLVGSDPVKLVDREKIGQALEMLGLSRYYLGQEEAAKLVFERLIFHDPDRSLDPITAPPEAVALYDALKKELDAELRIRREAIKKWREEQAQQRRVREIINNRENSRLLAVMPFGVGQFQNDDDLMGGLFLGTELIAIALSVSFWLAVEDLRNSENRFDRADVAQARNYQTAQLVSGGVAGALMIGGAIHALFNFRERVELNRETIQPPTISPAGAGILIRF